MNLLFAINHGYISMFLDCMRSILKNGGEDRYAVYLLHSDLTDADQAAITDSLGSGADVHFVPVDPALFDGFPESSRYPRQIYYRIAAPLLLPPDLGSGPIFGRGSGGHQPAANPVRPAL